MASRCRTATAISISGWTTSAGAGVAVVLFGFAKQGFAWYVHVAQAGTALYGALGAFLFFFVWLYFVSVVFVLGAEVGWVFEHREALDRAPSAER